MIKTKLFKNNSALDNKLHRLEPEELLAISTKISLNYAPLFSAKPLRLTRMIALTSKELLSISQEISGKYAPQLKDKTPKLILLPIDPSHLYVSYNSAIEKVNNPHLLENPTLRYIVRVYPVKDKSVLAKPSQDCFDIALLPGTTTQTIFVPAAFKAESYVAKLGTINQENEFTILASSKVTYNQPHNKAPPGSASNGSSHGYQFQA